MITFDPLVGTPVTDFCGIQAPPGAEVIASPGNIMEAIRGMADAIRPWINENRESPVVLVALLEGGRFYADRLIEELQALPTHPFDRINLKVSTRNGDGQILATPTVVGDLESLRGRRVLIIDDILDSGTTYRIMQERLTGVASELKTTVLIQKDDPEMNCDADSRPEVDFVGLSFRDKRWFSGAGMDMPGDPEGKARSSETVIAYPPVF